MIQVAISLRSLVFLMMLSAIVFAGSDVARGAPAQIDGNFDTLNVNGNIIFSGPGTDGARDIRTSDNDGGLRFYNGNGPLTNPPDGAAIQFFGNDRNVFNGQAFIDSGAHANAAIIFRTAGASEAVGERLRITAEGRVQAGTVDLANCTGATGTVCAAVNLIADSQVRTGVVNSSSCNGGGDVCAGADIVADVKVIAGSVTSTNCVDTGDNCAGDDLVSDDDVIVGSGCIRNANLTTLTGTCPSDVRLKQDIESLNPVLAQLTQLQPVTFNWRSGEFTDRNFGSDLNLGLIAQQVEAVMPGLVSESADGFKAVHYEQLPVLLLQSVRELKAENDSLRLQNETLEARLAAIEQRLSAQ